MVAHLFTGSEVLCVFFRWKREYREVWSFNVLDFKGIGGKSDSC
jgi:hypothetical protein